MKLRRIWRSLVFGLVNHFLTGTRFFDAKRVLLRSVGYEIGDGTKVVGPLFCTASLSIGCDCWIGRGFTIHGNGEVVIGDCCDIAPEVAVLTGGHEIGPMARRAGLGGSYSVRIGSGTWLGARSTLVGEVSVGSGCVVAACACVCSDVADNVLVGGVPAKVLRRLDDEGHAQVR